MLGGIGQTEIIIVLVIVLIIFGPKNLPKLARSMGQAIKDFKTGIRGINDEVSLDDDERDPVDTPATLERKSEGAAHQATTTPEENKVP